MLCVSLKNFVRICAPTSGGISDIVIFDPEDFNFTQAAATAGALPPYSAISRRTGVNGPNGVVFPISFTREEAEWTWKQTVKGCNVKYEHAFNFQLPENSHELTNFLQALDAASCCCGLGMIIRLSGGNIFIAGEKYVNASAIPRFTILNSGSSGSTGKLYDDFNGGNIILTGPFSRNLYEYSGAWSTIETMMTPIP